MGPSPRDHSLPLEIMRCPHCGFENTEGRKFCRGCAKPLASPEPAAPTPSLPAAPLTPEATVPSPPATANVHPMAIACLALSFLAIIVPVGIASVVMGHISRKQIAQSNGRQKGTGLAFAGLIISYLQFALVLLIAMGIHAAWHKMNQELDHDEFARAAMVEQIRLGSRKSSADVEKQRRYAIDALRLIHASQVEYVKAHPDSGYACTLETLGWDPSIANELDLYVNSSHYEIKIYECRGPEDPRYVVVAIPRSEANPEGSPIYCLDQTGAIRSSSGEWTSDIVRIFINERKPCPGSDPVVEQSE